MGGGGGAAGRVADCLWWIGPDISSMTVVAVDMCSHADSAVDGARDASLSFSLWVGSFGSTESLLK